MIGGCFDSEFAPWSNGLFRDFRRGTLVPVVSQVVAAEVDAAPPAVREKYAELLDCGAEVLDVNREVDELAGIYSPREVTHDREARDHAND